MGSEKYPDENAFMNYINEHGGATNAYTSDMNTNYQFEVEAEFLEPALDMMTNFFVDPILR
jgi:insulysin